MVKCTVPECPKEFKNRAGLWSHLRNTHQVRANGEPMSAEEIKRHKATLAQGAKVDARTVFKKAKAALLANPMRSTSDWHSPAAREKTRQTKAALRAAGESFKDIVTDAIENGAAALASPSAYYMKL